jgi:hypothetical protein
VFLLAAMTNKGSNTGTVAPTHRFLQQLELEWPYVSGATIWEFTAYMDPHGCSKRNGADCRRLYDDYRRYLSSRNSSRRL